MKVFTAHTRVHTRPILVREGFSWGALVLGPLWLLAHRAWIAAVLVICADAAIVMLTQGVGRTTLAVALAWLLGLNGHDILRWTLERRGYLLAHVVAAPDGDTALSRLLERRPDLIAEALA